jgi:chromate transporter
MLVRPTRIALFLCFLQVGSVSFGGGLSAWIRQATVVRRAWLDDRQFLTGLALCQIAPGPNAVNLSVYVGTVLHGGLGAFIALAGVLTVPVVFLLAAGALYLWAGALPAGSWIGAGLTGMGAAAIGMNIANGVQLTRRNTRGVASALIMTATAVSVGIIRWPLLWVLAVLIPASLAVTWWLERAAAVAGAGEG